MIADFKESILSLHMLKSFAFIALSIIFISFFGLRENALKQAAPPDVVNEILASHYTFPTITPPIDPTPTLEAMAKKTYPADNSDPIVNCVIGDNCGGGSRSMKKSECLMTTCCNRSDGKWYFYLDKNKCDSDKASDEEKLAAHHEDWNKFMSGLESGTRTLTNTDQNTIYAHPTADPAVIQECKDAINADLRNKMAGCTYFGGGTSSLQCEEKYKQEAQYAISTQCR
jgi:hypothetical protein